MGESTDGAAKGRDGYLGADVADAAGIPRDLAEDVLDAKQRGFRSDNILRIAQVPADQKRDFLLFMVQRPDGQVYFYLATVKDGLKKAFVSNPADKSVAVLETGQAQANFQQEILYWQAMYVPSGTPDAIVQTINAALQEAVSDPTIIKTWEEEGFWTFPKEKRSVAAAGEMMKSEIARWGQVIRDNNITVEQ